MLLGQFVHKIPRLFRHVGRAHHVFAAQFVVLHLEKTCAGVRTPQHEQVSRTWLGDGQNDLRAPIHLALHLVEAVSIVILALFQNIQRTLKRNTAIYENLGRHEFLSVVRILKNRLRLWFDANGRTTKIAHALRILPLSLC